MSKFIKYPINKGIATVFLIGIMVSLTVVPIYNLIERKKLSDSGVFTIGTIIGSSYYQKRTYIIYMFKAEDEYYTNVFENTKKIDMQIGTNVKIIYYPPKPENNRCISIILDE